MQWEKLQVTLGLLDGIHAEVVAPQNAPGDRPRQNRKIVSICITHVLLVETNLVLSADEKGWLCICILSFHPVLQ